LRFRAKKPLEILEAFVIQSTSSSCAANIIRRGNNCFAITFDFFDPRDGVVIQMAHTGTSSQDIDVVGRIVGGRKIQRREPSAGASKLRELGAILLKTQRGARRFVMWVMGVAGVVLIALPFVLPWIPSQGTNGTLSMTLMLSVGGLSGCPISGWCCQCIGDERLKASNGLTMNSGVQKVATIWIRPSQLLRSLRLGRRRRNG